VADNGEILGLESDYAGLGDIDRDKFELHLRNVLNNHFGAALVTTKMEICFYAVADKDVCQIDITPCAEPLLVKFPDKNGQPQERFYVRSGNSSQELSKGDMLAYIKERTLRNGCGAELRECAVPRPRPLGPARGQVPLWL
jgi:hypothetical protein